LIFALLLTLVFVLVLVAVPQPDVPRTSSVDWRHALAGYKGLLCRSPTVAMVSSYLFTFSGLALFIAYLPVWLRARMDVDEDGVAMLFALGGIAGVITNPVAGKLSDQYGRKIFIVGASIAFAGVALVSPFAGADFRVATFLFCLGMTAGAARTPAHQALVSSMVPANERGSLLSLGSAMGQSGFALGGALAGLLYTSVGFVGCTSAAAVAFLLTALLVGLFVPEPLGSTVTHP
jgi:predicted MFS family arabinose efflux permease